MYCSCLACDVCITLSCINVLFSMSVNHVFQLVLGFEWKGWNVHAAIVITTSGGGVIHITQSEKHCFRHYRHLPASFSSLLSMIILYIRPLYLIVWVLMVYVRKSLKVLAHWLVCCVIILSFISIKVALPVWLFTVKIYNVWPMIY